MRRAGEAGACAQPNNPFPLSVHLVTAESEEQLVAAAKECLFPECSVPKQQNQLLSVK